ncbi:sulfatase family protein [Flammeovirga kamogawensis]|uniref:Sulfatase-like hydrolase/transferase n=1 Tax=Flammeovirga kamogawensis TaxID=373891 RepID=A0ABX8GYT6_9BACT|nr:sulfatase-like hydrolase/transferase [Flammeovirga kamogawensis]MBB6459144.1 arylsulfatase A-like enzyme [Flammeovirga kamogawensis]QWG08711.1 sulfatase-like hydrolase/transferase [Flammeovirga kamogawensis]TRX67004.1 sulfatase-like hydrolase/transferase [Flammeovirga kamogawensis]
MKVFKFLPLIGISLLCLSFKSISDKPKEGKKPNIVLILADDMGFGDLGITGSTEIKTPNIDALGEKGVFFNQGYVSSPVCSPSRAGLLTGRNQVTFGYDNNLPKNLSYTDGLPTEIKTIPEYLKPLGYTSGIIGKWHLGDGEEHHPKNRFDEYWSFPYGGHNYFKNGKATKKAQKAYASALESNYKTPQEITYLTDDIGDECADFIKRHKDEPFFLYASFNAPHAPLQALEEDIALYNHIKDPKRRTYAAMVHRLDLNVAKIIAMLEKHNLDDNTIIVFLSDNGGPIGNGSLNAPYSGKKGTLLEGGIHVPFMMKWSKHIPENIRYEQTISSLDLAATFVTAAGGKVNDVLDGVDLVPYVNGENKEAPHQQMTWKFTVSRSIRDGNWKLVTIPNHLPMLFDLSKDISEQNDLLFKEKEKAEKMIKQLGNWEVALPNPSYFEENKYKALQQKDYYKKYQLKQPSTL